MEETNSKIPVTAQIDQDEPPKWDYTTSKSSMYTGAGVLGLNLLVILLVILDKTVPAVHSIITGKP